MMDLVYLYGPNGRTRTGELRHSLRSVDANLAHGRVWLAGWAPEWAQDVGVIPVAPVPEQASPTAKYRQTTANLLAACRILTRPFVLMNDDFFVMEPVASVPVLHFGRLKASPYMQRESPYAQAHRDTAAILDELGIVDPLNYELHVPMIVNPSLMFSLLQEYGRHGPILKRTLYGNAAQCAGVETTDVKVYRSNDPRPPGPFMSTSDTAWFGRVGMKLRARFPAPSRYESSQVA